MRDDSLKSIIYKLLAVLTFGVALALAMIVLHFKLGRADIMVVAQQLPVKIDTELRLPLSTSTDTIPATGTAVNDTATGTATEPLADELSRLRNLILGFDKNPAATPTAGAPEAEIAASQSLEAKLHTLQLTADLAYSPPGEGVKKDDLATGEVIIYNESAVKQSLIATTRLQSPDGVIFRLINAVAVPAGGSVKTTVRADEKFRGEPGNLAATSFSIPGLPASKQKFVYAKSQTPFKGGVKYVKTLTDQDFTAAQAELKKILEQKAVEEFNKLNLAITLPQITWSQIDYTTTAKPGEENSSLEMSATAVAEGLEINTPALLAETKAKLKETLPASRKMLAYKEDSFTYQTLEVNQLESWVNMHVYLEGYSALSDSAELIEPSQLVGLKAADIQKKLMASDAVQEVRVKFSPFWVTRAPRLVEKIKIELVASGATAGGE